MINSSEPTKKKHKSIENQFVDHDESFNEASLFIQPSVSQKCDELDKYMKMATDDRLKTSNPLPFWHYYKEKLPNLAKLARRLFSIPATPANVERQFSAKNFDRVFKSFLYLMLLRLCKNPLLFVLLMWLFNHWYNLFMFGDWVSLYPLSQSCDKKV